jgi:hypothetical protein
MKREIPMINQQNIPMKQTCHGRQITILCMVLVVILVILALSAGCIKAVQKYADSAHDTTMPPENATMVNITTPVPNATPEIWQGEPIAMMTPARSALVTEVTPITTPDPYPILHATRINDTPQYNRLMRPIQFLGGYPLRGNAYGLQVNVVEAPLVIMYVVVPQNDCMLNPDSCRGTKKAPVNRPWMTITVRDNQTQEIVDQDGYGREYSSDTGRYEFHITSDNSDGTTSPYTSNTLPRYLVLYRSGVYHIDLEGNFLDMYVAMQTGSSPTLLDIGNGDTTDMGTSADQQWWV